MTNAERERRILILAPTGKDATLTQSILRRAGVDSMTCRSLEQLCDEIQEGVGAVLLAEEAVQGSATRLARCHREGGGVPWWEPRVEFAGVARGGVFGSAGVAAVAAAADIGGIDGAGLIAAVVGSTSRGREGADQQQRAEPHAPIIPGSVEAISDPRPRS